MSLPESPLLQIWLELASFTESNH